MKYFSREITERKPINRFGRLGYVAITEYVKTNDITPFNRGKRIRFEENQEAKKYLLHLEKDTVYREEGEILSRHAAKPYKW